MVFLSIVVAVGSDYRVVDNSTESWRFSLQHKLTGMIDRIATVRVLVVLTLLSVLFPAILFPAAGIGDDRPLDLYFSYSPDQAYEYLGGLGEKGRSAYAKMELTTDFLFPVIYSLALTIALAMAARRVLTPDSRLHSLRFFPFLIVIADWFENLSLTTVIHAYPDLRDSIITAASLFTSLKWVFLTLTVMMLLLAGNMVVAMQFRDR